MALTPQAIKEFKEIYRQKFGVELNDKDALELAIKLITMMRAIYKPVPHDEETDKI